jgi:hypothetical protein
VPRTSDVGRLQDEVEAKYTLIFRAMGICSLPTLSGVER